MGFSVKYLVLSCAFVFLSCGTRKTEIELQKANTERLTKLVLQLQNDIQSNVRMTKVAKKKIIEPVDPSIPSTYNGQDFKNAKITEEEETVDSTATNTDNSTTDLKIEDSESTSNKTKKKDVESKKPNPWLWSGLFVAIIVISGMLIKFRPWSRVNS